MKESTRKTALEAARALGYVPSASARGLAKGRTTKDRAAAVVAPNDDCRLFPVYVDEVQRGVELETRPAANGRLLTLPAGLMGLSFFPARFLQR
ncbi:hypothetical protein [Arthrobacter sp. 1088]|uniref:hypothetical protein n=1 Tax=Arthrobacter sp. 1088 TaxID=2817768 RepID=UPI00286BF423|nr:hypothetical protein [Arthrobacter sp. 1088]